MWGQSVIWGGMYFCVSLCILAWHQKKIGEASWEQLSFLSSRGIRTSWCVTGWTLSFWKKWISLGFSLFVSPLLLISRVEEKSVFDCKCLGWIQLLSVYELSLSDAFLLCLLFPRDNSLFFRFLHSWCLLAFLKCQSLTSTRVLSVFSEYKPVTVGLASSLQGSYFFYPLVSSHI